MMNYTLYNKQLDQFLVHPKIGLWFTSDLNEAFELLSSCQEYVSGLGVDIDNFIVVDVDTKEEICLSPRLAED